MIPRRWVTTGGRERVVACAEASDTVSGFDDERAGFFSDLAAHNAGIGKGGGPAIEAGGV